MSQEKFPKEEFAKQCLKRGYASRGGKNIVLRWCKDHPKEYYTEDDMIAVYRYFDERNIRDWGNEYGENNSAVSRYESWLCNASAREIEESWYYD